MGGHTAVEPSNGVEQQLEQARKTRLLNILTGSAIVICVIFLLFMYFPLIDSRWPYKLIFWLLLGYCLLSFFLNRAGHFLAASLLYTIGLTLSIFAVILVGIFEQGIVGWAIYYFLVPVLVAGMILGARSTFSIATVNVLLIVIISVVAYHVLEFDVPQYASEVISIVVPAGILCYVMALVAWLYGSSLEGALHQLTERSHELQAANREIRAFSHTLEDKVEERTEELREFTSMVAHDLRNPLTVIRGYAEILQEEVGPHSNERQQRALQTVAINVEHMLHLTDDLLELSRIRSGAIQFDMEALPVEVVIEEVCASFEPRLAEKRLGLKFEIAPELPPVWGDHLRLAQVLSNLVVNAYDYTPSGAIIIGARPSNGSIEVSVSDTGIGIPPEEQKRLFTHFFRGEHDLVRSKKGTGLGLIIAHSIVTAHGGEIWVESEVDKGSTFRFTLPVASDPPPVSGTLSLAGPLLAG